MMFVSRRHAALRTREGIVRTGEVFVQHDDEEILRLLCVVRRSKEYFMGAISLIRSSQRHKQPSEFWLGTCARLTQPRMRVRGVYKATRSAVTRDRMSEEYGSRYSLALGFQGHYWASWAVHGCLEGLRGALRVGALGGIRQERGRAGAKASLGQAFIA